jgi:hypothetical protein
MPCRSAKAAAVREVFFGKIRHAQVAEWSEPSAARTLWITTF